MITIELTHALLLYSSVLAALIMGIWIYTEFTVKRPQRFLGKQFLRVCSFCRFSYLDENTERLSQCPRCESINAFGPEPEAGSEEEFDYFAAPQDLAAEKAAHRNTSRKGRHHRTRRGPRRRR